MRPLAPSQQPKVIQYLLAWAANKLYVLSLAPFTTAACGVADFLGSLVRCSGFAQSALRDRSSQSWQSLARKFGFCGYQGRVLWIPSARNLSASTGGQSWWINIQPSYLMPDWSNYPGMWNKRSEQLRGAEQVRLQLPSCSKLSSSTFDWIIWVLLTCFDLQIDLFPYFQTIQIMETAQVWNVVWASGWHEEWSAIYHRYHEFLLNLQSYESAPLGCLVALFKTLQDGFINLMNVNCWFEAWQEELPWLFCIWLEPEAHGRSITFMFSWMVRGERASHNAVPNS